MEEVTKYLYVNNILYNTLGFSAELFESLKKEAQVYFCLEDSQLTYSEYYTDDPSIVEEALANLHTAVYYKQKIIIYHANCADGLAAAAVMKTQYPNAILIPGSYGYPRFTFKDCDIYFVDFSYKKDDMKILLVSNANVHMIDHHKSAIEDTANLPLEYDNFYPYVAQNNEKSGVGLAWSFLHGTKELPYAYQLIQDRDLWTWLLNGKNILKVIDTFYPRTVKAYQDLGQLTKEEVLALEPRGADLVFLEESMEDTLIKDSLTHIDIFGYTEIPCINAHGMFASHVGNKIINSFEHYPFALLWQVTKKGLKISIRSADEREDASLIAQMFSPNGGGHHNAAGVLIPVDTPFAKILLGL